MPDLTFDSTAVAAWSNLTDDQDRAVLDLVVPAVESFVNGLPDAARTEAGEWAPETHLAAVMLASRLARRRNSPAGIDAFTADGAAYVSRSDSDVARLLRIDSYQRPQVG